MLLELAEVDPFVGDVIDNAHTAPKVVYHSQITLPHRKPLLFSLVRTAIGAICWLEQVLGDPFFDYLANITSFHLLFPKNEHI